MTWIYDIYPSVVYYIDWMIKKKKNERVQWLEMSPLSKTVLGCPRTCPQWPLPSPEDAENDRIMIAVHIGAPVAGLWDCKWGLLAHPEASPCPRWVKFHGHTCCSCMFGCLCLFLSLFQHLFSTGFSLKNKNTERKQCLMEPMWNNATNKQTKLFLTGTSFFTTQWKTIKNSVIHENI